MSILQERGSRGASVLAAVAFVSLFGVVAMVLLNISPSSSNPQAVAADSGVNSQLAAAADATISDVCKKGEVHTIREVVSGETGKPKDDIKKCFIPDLEKCATSGVSASSCTILKINPDPAVANDSACQKGIPAADKCVVRYCLSSAASVQCTTSTAEKCVIIKCNDGDSECAKKAIGTATNSSSCVTAISGLMSQGASDGTGVSVSTRSGVITGDDAVKTGLDPKAYTAVQTIQESEKQQAIIDKSSNFLNSCDIPASTSEYGFTTCSSSQINEANNAKLAAEQEKARLDGVLARQMDGLNKNQVGMTPDDPTVPIGTTGGTRDDATVPIGTTGGTPAIEGPCKGAVNLDTGMCGTLSGDGRPTAGDVLTQPAYCVTNIEPVVVKNLQAGTVFPSNCYNDKRLPPLPTAAPQPTSGFNNTTGGNGAVNNSSGKNPLASLFSGPGSNGLFYQLGSMLGNLIKGNGLTGSSQQQMACATTQDQYQQQQQQYNQQIQQYNYQLQQQQYQQQQQMMQQQYYGGGYSPYGAQNIGGNGMYGQPMTPPPPQPPQPCYNNQQPQQCSYSPQQPSYDSCTSGTWKSTTSGNGCVSGWQCVPNIPTTGGTGTGSTANTPAATISCQPKVADIGMTIAISYACANATQSAGGGFNTNGAIAGSATTTVLTPPANTNTVTYTLTCNNQGQTAGAQCSVQFGNPDGIFLADPESVPLNGSSTLGWITTGMRSCVVSSPDLPSFTAQNKDISVTNGVAIASGLTADTGFELDCTTVGGAEMLATTTVYILQ